MQQVIQVNGKKYEQSGSLATAFGYTSDYIARLAREEKIIGMQQGRQWFVEPNSLRVFILKNNFEKEISKDELRIRRKRERNQFEQTQPTLFLAEDKISIQLLQSIVVFCCGVFIAVISFVVWDEKISASDFSTATLETGSFVAQALKPFSVSVGAPVFMDSVVTSFAPEQTPFFKQSLQEMHSSDLVDYFSSESSLNHQAFSDEITIDKNNDVVVVTPHFKNGPNEQDSVSFLTLVGSPQ
jgi:hypothetical protein